jgi:hypothetical protein
MGNYSSQLPPSVRKLGLARRARYRLALLIVRTAQKSARR